MFKEIPINPVNCNHNGGSLDKLLPAIPEHPHITVLFAVHLETARTANSPELRSRHHEHFDPACPSRLCHGFQLGRCAFQGVVQLLYHPIEDDPACLGTLYQHDIGGFNPAYDTTTPRTELLVQQYLMQVGENLFLLNRSPLLRTLLARHDRTIEHLLSIHTSAANLCPVIPTPNEQQRDKQDWRHLHDS